jgi:hypothetical protein
MARSGSLDDASVAVAEVEILDEAAVSAELERAFGQNPSASIVDKHSASLDSENVSSEGGPGNEELRTFYFGSLTITVGKIKEMEEKCYFAEDEARAPGVEIVPEPNNDEAVVYEYFFVAGLRMFPHPVLTDILLHF